MASERRQSSSAWHPGETALQTAAGVAELMAPVAGQVIRNHLIEQHRAFFPKLPFIIAGTVSPEGDAWATVLAGMPGFLRSPDAGRLRVTSLASPRDPAAAGMKDGDSIGLIGIKLPTRRRNRLNGRIDRIDETTFDVIVAQSFGNCPQYIRQRNHHFVRDPMIAAETEIREPVSLDAACVATITKAETFFITSYVDRDGQRDVDVSHKGGRPGFVHVNDTGTLTIPDFAGNRYFNTLGNILLNPRCGLIFVDFDTGDVLQLSGDGEVVLDGPEIQTFNGAERLLRFTPRRIVFRRGALPLRWSSPQEGKSPSVLRTGTWDEAASRQRTAERATTWRAFRIVRTVNESAVIRSLYFLPTDGDGLMPWGAGQHITIRLQSNDGREPETRSYTLSSAPSDGVYRISVKREGIVSAAIHSLSVGDTIEARAPAGRFTANLRRGRPIVLLAAGVGITPLLSMLRHIVHEGERTGYFHPTWLIQSAHKKAERAFDEEIASLAAAGGKAVALTRVLSDTSGSKPEDYDVAGRTTVELLKEVSPLAAFDFYICGPRSFAQNLYDGLRALAVPDDQIFAESFGPASLQRDHGTQSTHAAAEHPVDVTFATSRTRATWTPESGSLLEFAEAQGLVPAFDCRRGTCGSCAARILGGSISYTSRPSVILRDGEVLLCCSVPADKCDATGLILEL